MGFFAEFSAWLNGILATYIGENTARIAGALQPAIITLGVLYLMVWGICNSWGRSRSRSSRASNAS
jgi:type IV secretion system protein VirB6